VLTTLFFNWPKNVLAVPPVSYCGRLKPD